MNPNDALRNRPEFRLLSLREAAIYIGVSYWTTRTLVHSGQIPRVQVVERRILIDVRDLDNFIEANKTREDSF